MMDGDRVNESVVLKMKSVLRECLCCSSQSYLASYIISACSKTPRPQQQPSLLQLALNRKPEGSVERKWAVTPGGLLLLVYCFVSAYVPH